MFIDTMAQPNTPFSSFDPQAFGDALAPPALSRVVSSTSSMSSTRRRSGVKVAKKTELPADFQPSKYSVICGLNTREVLQSTGNRRFRVTVELYLDEYKIATGKSAKSTIVTKVMNIIREACPDGGAFIKQQDGRWYEVSERCAREKVGALFRDCLHTSYKSSHKSKTAKKQQERQKMHPLKRETSLKNWGLGGPVAEFPVEEESDLDFPEPTLSWDEFEM